MLLFTKLLLLVWEWSLLRSVNFHPFFFNYCYRLCKFHHNKYGRVAGKKNSVILKLETGAEKFKTFFFLSFVTSFSQPPLVNKQSPAPVVYYRKRHQFDLDLFVLLAWYFSLILDRPVFFSPVSLHLVIIRQVYEVKRSGEEAQARNHSNSPPPTFRGDTGGLTPKHSRI